MYANVFGDDSQKIVIPAFAGHTMQRLKDAQVATYEGLEALTMGELGEEHPAVSLDQAEGKEVSLVTGVVEGAKVAPVDREALRPTGLHAHESARRINRATQLAGVISRNGDSTVVLERP